MGAAGGAGVAAAPPDPARLAVEVLLFLAGVAALAAAGYPLVAVVFAVVVAASITLDRVLA